MLHTLKTWPAEFAAVKRREKHHEVRKFDRDYKVGDTLQLVEYDPATGQYSGDEMLVQVTYITSPGTFGLPRDVGVMSVIRKEFA